MVIFSEIFDEGLLRTHSLGELTMPSGFEAVWGSNFPVMYEMVQLFDFADGTSAADVDMRAEGWSSDELFGNRDPRFAASIFILKLTGKEIKYISILIPPIMILVLGGLKQRQIEIKIEPVFI